MESGAECKFECDANTYINEAKTHCVSTCSNQLSSDGKSCVASCVTGLLY